MNPRYQSVAARAGHRCEYCNLFKSDVIDAIDLDSGERTRLFNPRRDDWETHFRLDIEHGAIDGLTGMGRATVHQLRLNGKTQRSARKQWMRIGLVP